jgi:hypothetical protein
MHRCGILQPRFVWQDVMEEGCRNWRTKSMFRVVCRLVLSFAVYGLWRARNEVKHASQPLTNEQILKHIFWEVKSQVAGKGKSKKIKANISLCHSWNMDTAMLV